MNKTIIARVGAVAAIAAIFAGVALLTLRAGDPGSPGEVLLTGAPDGYRLIAPSSGAIDRDGLGPAERRALAANPALRAAQGELNRSQGLVGGYTRQWVSGTTRPNYLLISVLEFRQVRTTSPTPSVSPLGPTFPRAAPSGAVDRKVKLDIPGASMSLVRKDALSPFVAKGSFSRGRFEFAIVGSSLSPSIQKEVADLMTSQYRRARRYGL